jgi:hypothetical protein
MSLLADLNPKPRYRVAYLFRYLTLRAWTLIILAFPEDAALRGI